MARAVSFGFVWEKEQRAAPMLRNATFRTVASGWYAPRNVNPYWVFDYSLTSYGLYKVGAGARRWSERAPHVGHLYPPRVPYAEDLRHEPGPIEDAWVVFTGGDLIGLRRLIPAGFRYARFLDAGGLMAPLLRKAAEVGREEGEPGFWKAQGALCEIIGLLLSARPLDGETYAIGSTPPTAECSPWLASVQDYLRETCARPIRLGEVARHFNISLSSLCHRYRAETGESPMNARLRLRIELAKNLLLKGHSLKLIAVETGFCDPYHLSKTFKHFTGIPPRRFVQSLRSPLRRRLGCARASGKTGA